MRLQKLSNISSALPCFPGDMEYVTIFPDNTADAAIVKQLLADAAELGLVSLIDQKYALVFPVYLVFSNPVDFARLVEWLPDETPGGKP